MSPTLASSKLDKVKPSNATSIKTVWAHDSGERVQPLPWSQNGHGMRMLKVAV
jgi:hypothetical protein